MKELNKHNEQWTNDDDFMKSLPDIELPYSRSKEDIWKDFEAELDADDEETETKKGSGKVIKLNTVLKYSAAAVLLIFLSIGSFMKFYTTTIIAPNGEHIAAILPDGSSIELNAGSVIKYKPYWWNYERKVLFEGEAFFKVSKGKSFVVESSFGTTTVLGTSFNIYARKNEYKVTCYTGKVRVVSTVSRKSTELVKNQLAVIKGNGEVVNTTIENSEENISWMNDMFIFTATPLNLVFEEIERQFGVSINTDEKINYLYSGNFTRNSSPELVLDIVCKSLGLNYKKEGVNFTISKKNIKSTSKKITEK